MAPREAGARYAADPALSSVAARGLCQHGIDARERALTSEERERHIDRWRDSAAGHRHTERLRDLAESAVERRRKLIYRCVNRRSAPLGQGREARSGVSEHRGRISAEMLCGGLGVQGHHVSEEEATVLGHLLHRLCALALRENYALEQRQIVAVQAEAAQL